MIRDVRTFAFAPGQRLFLDTNVWLDVLGPQSKPDEPRVVAYSEALGRMIESGASVFLDATVVSEFTNAVMRYFHRAHDNGISAKAYRATPHYRQNVPAIKSYLASLLSSATLIEGGVRAAELPALVMGLDDARLDFNDLVILGVCRRENLTLVTDDVDFRGADVELLTANTHLLDYQARHPAGE